MFTKVNIKNFKSIKDLELTPRRVNVFIGEPNAGKSNILEALAVFSEGVYDNTETLQDVLRFKTPYELFFDHEVAEEAHVSVQEQLLKDSAWSLKFTSNRFDGKTTLTARESLPTETGQELIFTLQQNGHLQLSRYFEAHVKFYRYKSLDQYPQTKLGALYPPYGTNLVSLLTTNKYLRNLVGDIFRDKNFRLVIYNERYELIVQKEIDDQLYQFRYSTMSETLRRIAFFMTALETNKDSVIVFDEPEANTFPFYTKYLAERIGLDKSNQYFLTTHNPYLLASVVEKTPISELAVFVTRMENYRTKVSQVRDDKLPEFMALDMDVFFNLDRLVDE